MKRLLAALAVLAAGLAPVAGTASVLALGDDDTVEVPFPGGFSFPFFGVAWHSLFVNSNGNVTFGRGDILSIPDTAAFLAGPPRIAALWTDLDPSSAGVVTAGGDASSFTVTFDGVPAFGEGAGNTFAIVLRPDGSFDLACGAVATRVGFSGYSAGGNVTKGDEGPVDLSAQTKPIGNGSRPAVHEVFTDTAPFDLGGETVPFRATWDRFHFYASDTSAGELQRVNGWQATAEGIGPIGYPGVQGLAFSPAGELYGADTSSYPASALLLRIDPATGTGTAIGPIGFPDVRALAFAPDGTLWGVELDPALDQTNLVTIDTSTGLGTRRAPLSAADVQGLAFTPDGSLYAADDDTDRLIAVDPATGAETPVGPLGYDRVTGLEATAEGRLFAVRQVLVAGQGFRSHLLEISRATGRATEIGETGPGALGSLAWRCEATAGGIELCDGLDNDCDGLGDEDFPGLGMPCTSGLGQCARQGVRVCSLDGATAGCDAVPGTPAPEICDGLDDDCNGVVEDDLDEDGDGRSLCAGDCDDADPGAFRAPGEVHDLRLEAGMLLWEDLRPGTGSGTRYDVVVSLSPLFADPQCLLGDAGPGPIPDPTSPPAPGSILYFLVRAENGCGTGTWGTDSAGRERTLPPVSCP